MTGVEARTNEPFRIQSLEVGRIRQGLERESWDIHLLTNVEGSSGEFTFLLNLNSFFNSLSFLIFMVDLSTSLNNFGMTYFSAVLLYL